MIPKIIHYSWFSGDPYPAPVKLYLETWKKVLPDYEFVLWDMNKIREIDSVFLNEALQEHKWAFAADLTRCYAVYKYGGIWLDIDVEMRKPFDELLDNRMFIGKECISHFIADGAGKHMHTLTSHCFGAEAGHPFLARCLEYYEGRRFILSSNRTLPERLRYDVRTLPDIQACIACQEFGYDGGIRREDEIEHIVDGITVYPYWYFEQPKYMPINECFCIHHFFGAWQPANHGHEYDNKGLYQVPKKNLDYYVFTLLNKLLKPRGYKLLVICFGR